LLLLHVLGHLAVLLLLLVRLAWLVLLVAAGISLGKMGLLLIRTGVLAVIPTVLLMLLLLLLLLVDPLLVLLLADQVREGVVHAYVAESPRHKRRFLLLLLLLWVELAEVAQNIVRR
jgi:hypothetical protein